MSQPQLCPTTPPAPSLSTVAPQHKPSLLDCTLSQTPLKHFLTNRHCDTSPLSGWFQLSTAAPWRKSSSVSRTPSHPTLTHSPTFAYCATSARKSGAPTHWSSFASPPGSPKSTWHYLPTTSIRCSLSGCAFTCSAIGHGSIWPRFHSADDHLSVVPYILWCAILFCNTNSSKLLEGAPFGLPVCRSIADSAVLGQSVPAIVPSGRNSSMGAY